MDGNHPDYNNSRPKRRKRKDNPYTLYIVSRDSEEPLYCLSFTDQCGMLHRMEIAKEIYDTFDRFELDDLSEMNEADNHYESSELTEESLNARLANPPASLEDSVFSQMQHERLHSAVNELPEIQKRRVTLYYFSGYTFEQIAKLEHCTKSAVKKSVDAAIENLKKYFEISDL